MRMQSDDVSELTVGTQIAVDVAGKSASRSMFRFGTVSRTTASTVEVVTDAGNFCFSKRTTKAIRVANNWHEGYRLWDVQSAREVLARREGMQKLQAMNSENMREIAKLAEGMTLDTAHVDALRALANKIEQQLADIAEGSK
jgi:hypothetical protein